VCECVCVGVGVGVWVWVCVSVCVCVCERERESVCVCVCERERVCVCVSVNYCVCERERERVCVCVLLHLVCAVLHCRVWPAPLDHIFPHYIINGMIFQKSTEHEIHVFSPQLLSEKKTLLILRSTRRDILNVKYPLFLKDFNESLIVLTAFRKILNHQISR
jgi:hypothetical protein